MPLEEPRLLTQPDGNVLVFYRGWRFAFAESAEEPTVTKADAPPGAPAAGGKVKTGGPRMRYGRWLAVFDPTGKRAPLVIKAKPP